LLVASATSNVGASSLVSTALSDAFYRLDDYRNLRKIRNPKGMNSAFPLVGKLSSAATQAIRWILTSSSPFEIAQGELEG